MTYKDSKASGRYLNININGNHKLVNTDAVRFMVMRKIKAIIEVRRERKLAEKLLKQLDGRVKIIG